jgi:hypothetical protein
MKYMKLDQRERQIFLADLESMPDFLAGAFAKLASSELVRSGSNGSFCPVEHVWHLADLERDGFAVRIRRLQAESDPQLPDFDGDLVAKEGSYKLRTFESGIAAFRAARSSNISILRNLAPSDWLRQGEQEGVGTVSMCDMPAMMAEHDEAHRMEIGEWLESRES